MKDVEEDELEERSSSSEDVVVQPDGAWTHALRVELLGEVVTRAQEVRVEDDQEYVQCQNAHCVQWTQIMGLRRSK